MTAKKEKKKGKKNINIKVRLPKELPEEEALKEEDLAKAAGGGISVSTCFSCPHPGRSQS